ncbi:MAG TPA: TonB-dependent receptor [Bryobacteraceae bacterium]|nr:TonB-dependent receptor [Bryobacteraceae bacterium]
MRRAFPIFFCALVCASAQINTASLGGLITDPSQAVVSGVVVSARHKSTGVQRVTRTNDTGYYSFASLPVGDYEVTAEHPGFEKMIKRVTLETAEKARQDFTLNVGQVDTTVEVRSAAPQLSRDDATLGTVVDNNYVSKFPLMLRTWDDLLTLVPGVQASRYTEQSGATSAGRTGDFNVHGVRSLQNNFILDGVDNNTFSENVQELTTQAVRPSVDAIQEFKVITNPYSAEYGRSPGAAVIVTTKSGTNQVHGLLYEYLRNNVFDANDFFSNRSGLKKPQNQRNQFGGDLGGPLRKNRLFGFFDWESTRINTGVSRITTVPLPNERIGDFSAAAAAAAGVPDYPAIYDPASHQPFANNQIPASRLDGSMQKIMPLFPLPNLPGENNNFARNGALTDDADLFSGRMDWTPDARDTVFGRYSWATRARFIPGNFGGIADGTSTSAFGRQNLTNHGAAIGWTRVISPRLVNEFRLAFTRDNSYAQQDPFGLNHAADFVPGIPENPAVDGGVPLITFTGYNTYIGSPAFLPKFQITQQFEFSDTLSWNLGRHQLKFGADLHAPMRNIFLDVPGTRGTIGFDRIFTCQRNASNQCAAGTGLSYADALLGYVQNAQLSNVYFADQRLHMYAFFAQDDFKVTPRLTLNLGLRYDFATPLLEGRNHIANFDYATGQLFLAKPGSLQDRSTVQPNRLNFAPRVGLAYQIDSKTVLRTGYGIFYSMLDRNGSENQAALNPPFLVNNTPAVPSTAAQPVMLLAQGFAPNFLDPATLNYKVVHIRSVPVSDPFPYVQQWSFGFQRELPAGLFAEADYVGSKTTHINAIYDANSPLNGAAPYPNFGYLEFTNPLGNGSYQGLDLSLERRLNAGLAFRLSYTFSKNIDNVNEPLESLGSGGVQNIRNFAAWRGPADFDVPHRVVLSYVYELPFGKGKPLASHGVLSWIVGGFRTSGSYTFASGKPFTVSSGGAIGNSIDPAGAELAVPNVIGTPLILGNPGCWFYASQNSACRALAPSATNAFALQAPGQYGNAGRNILRGPHTNVFDFAVHRDFPIREQAGVEFRWEVFNLTNTVQFGKPNADFSSGAVGSITTLAADPRVMQFALRLHF